MVCTCGKCWQSSSTSRQQRTPAASISESELLAVNDSAPDREAPKPRNACFFVIKSRAAVENVMAIVQVYRAYCFQALDFIMLPFMTGMLECKAFCALFH